MLLFMPEEAPGLISGRYLLAEPVGQAGLGRIWRGHDQLLDREVAVMEISLPPRPGGGRAGTVDDIMRKVRAAARNGAAGGITVHDVAEQAGALWVVTQPGEGRSLDATIAASGPLHPVAESLVTAPPVPVPSASARPAQAAPPAPSPAGRGTGRLAAAMRANAGLTVGLVTGLVMILALVLVVLLFPSHYQPASPPGRPTVSPASSAP